MGKLTLLLVVAATLGGAYLTLSMQGLLGEGAHKHTGEQQDLLAREIAESGHDLILADMMGNDGFETPGSPSSGELDGGYYHVAFDDDVLPSRAVLTARGMYGGAEHVISSEHEFDAMEYPGPIWIDVPYATVESDPGVEISGGADGPGIRFDRRQNDDFRLGGFLPAGEVEDDLRAAAAAAGSNYKATGTASTAGGEWAGLLDDLNVRDAEELYEAAKAAATETKTGPITLTDHQAWGGSDPTAVTFVDGDLNIHNSGRLTGHGVLVVNGALQIEKDDGSRGNGRLEWTGIVIVRSDRAVMPVTFNGNRARITGALVIVQRSFPPGGHLDVTVNRSPTGMAGAVGDKTGGPGQWADPGFTWYQHNHEFDIKPTSAPRGKRVEFLQGGGAGPHETEVAFHDLLSTLGSTRVYLEFGNPTRHGFAQYRVNVDGMSAPLEGSARNGWGPSFASGGNVFRSRTFSADELRDLSIEVMALRSLQPRFDGVGSCRGDEWPYCIGESWDRKGAFSVQLKKASGARPVLYSASLYWHMRADEVAQHEAEEQTWRDAIAAGGGYGTHLKMGDGTRVTYSRGVILQLADRLGFEGNRIIKRGYSSRTRSANAPDRQRGADGLYAMCHSGSDIRVAEDALRTHMAHGDSRGLCEPPAGGAAGGGASGGATGGTGGTGGGGGTGGATGGATGGGTTGGGTTVPPDRVAICNKPGSDGDWWDRNVDMTDLATHLGHGCLLGTCASNGHGTTGGGAGGGGTAGGGTGGGGTGGTATSTTATTVPGLCTLASALVKVCRPPSGGDTSWNDVEMTCADAAAFLVANPGSLPGTCSDNGR